MAKTTAIADIGVAIVDDDADARLCFEDILLEAGGYTCIGSFSNANDALKNIPRLSPDLVLMDIRLPGLNGIECVKSLKQMLPCLKIVMVSGLHDDHSIEKSLKAGAVAFLVKPVTPHQCLATLKCAASIGTASPQKSAPGLPAPSSVTCPLLTPRENDLMRLLAEGLLYKEISDKLQISYPAVHKIQHRIYRKLHASNRTEAISRWRGEKPVLQNIFLKEGGADNTD